MAKKKEKKEESGGATHSNTMVGYVPRMKERYKKEVAPALQKKFLEFKARLAEESRAKNKNLETSQG